MGLAMLYNTIVIIAATMLMSIKLAKVFVVFIVLFFYLLYFYDLGFWRKTTIVFVSLEIIWGFFLFVVATTIYFCDI